MTSLEKKYSQFLEILDQAKRDGFVIILHRGESIEFAFYKLGLYTSCNTIEQFAERLFLFGDKAKYFWENRFVFSNINIGVNDISESAFKNIFIIFNDLINSAHKEATLKYFKKNCSPVNFFKDSSNVDNFVLKAKLLPQEKRLFYRNYYLRIIHQLGETNYNESSLLISSSRKEDVALFFSNNGLIINFWDLNFTNREVFVDNMPIFIGKPYKNQKEISVFSAIFPHFIYSFEYKGNIYINPALKLSSHFQSAILNGFEIQQDNFVEKLKKIAKYKSGVLTNGDNFWELK